MRVAFFLILIFLASCRVLFGDASAGGLEAAAENLGAAAFADREEASRYLWRQGPAAKGVLEKAAVSEDPEVRLRAREIMKKINMGVFEDTPADLAERLSRYDQLNDAGRQSLLEELAGHGEAGWGSLHLIASSHIGDGNLSLEPLAGIAGDRDFLLTLLAESSDWGNLIENLLTAKALSRRGESSDLISWLMVKGTLEERIADFEKLATKGTRETAYIKVLAPLYRAAGKLEEAMKAAKATGQDNLAFRSALEGGYYDIALRALDICRGSERGIKTLGWRIALQRLAGRHEEKDESLAELLDIVRQDNSETWLAAKVLLINEMLPQAISLLKEYPTGVSLVSAFDRRPEDYISLNEFFIGKGGETELPYIVFLHRNGEKDRAQKLLGDIVAKISPASPPENIASVISTAREISCGCFEKLLTDACASPETDFKKLANGVFGTLSFWRDYYKLKHPGDSELQILMRLSELSDAKTSKEELSEMLDELDSMLDKVPPEKHIEMRQTMRDLYKRAGNEKGCISQINKLIELDEGIASLLDLGDWHAARKEWTTAAEWYGKAAGKEPEQALPLYLLGNAVSESGDKQQGEEKMLRASLMPFGDLRLRLAFANGLMQREMLQPARANYNILRCAHSFNSWYLQQAHSRIYQIDSSSEVEGEKWSESIRYMMLGNLECLAPHISYVYLGAYLLSAYEYRLAHAKGLLASGDAPKAAMEFKKAFDFLHEDVDAVIDAVMALGKKDLQEQADEIYSTQKTRILKELELLPNSSNTKNSLSWLMSRTGRDLEQALELSRQAVESEPQNAAFLDTLAEVHFRLKNRVQAVAWQKKAVEHASERDREFMQKRLESFQDDPFHE